MVDQALKDYIQQNLSDGFAETEIRKVLREAGWSELDVEETFLEINPSAVPNRPTAKPATQPAPTISVADVGVLTESVGAETLPRQTSFFAANKKLLIGILIFIVVFPVLAYAGIIGYEKFFKQGAESLQTTKPLTPTPPAPPPPPPEDLQAAAKKRDAQRLEDIDAIQTALSSFYASQQAFPKTLGELVLSSLLSKIPTDPKTNQNYLYTALGDPVLHYSLSFVLETDQGTLESGLQVGSSESQLPVDEIKQQEEAVQGTVISTSPNLVITDLSQTPFYPQEEVTLEVAASDASLESVVLAMDHLNLMDQKPPWVFRFSAPKNPGEYLIKILAFDRNGQTLSQTTKLIVKGGGN